MARVQNEGDAREVRGAHAVDELVRLEPTLLLLDALRIVWRAELRREILDRNLDRVTHRDRADVRDPVSLRDLRRLGVDVLGVKAPGQPDDDRRVERFSALQPVERVAPFFVASELHRQRSSRRRGPGLVAEGRGEQLQGNSDDLSPLGRERFQAVRGLHLFVVRAVAREPLRDAPEALRLSRERGDAVDPALFVARVEREERLDRDTAVVLRQQTVRNPDEDVGSQEPHALVLRQDFLLGARVVGEAPDESVQALGRQRPRRERDLVPFTDRDLELRRDDDRLVRGERIRRREDREREKQGCPDASHRATAESGHRVRSGRREASRRAGRSRARTLRPPRRPAPRRSGVPGSAARAEAPLSKNRTER